ncbi:MAG TPA: sigma-70 family RNA polymerase sigma factor [Isosphaeraceae bacterium]|jgi:RNA polymerase sigma factor (sigma-70 family)
MTDGELLERFVNGRDETAFESLVRRHGAMVLGLCRRALGDDHEAEDAFQATFLVLVRNARTIRKRESLASWLYGVAQRVARRAQSRAKQRSLVLHGEATVATGPDSDHDRFELKPIVHDEVERLPEKYRAPIVLCYFEGQSHEEAARQLDWPVGTVKGRLSRARGILQSRLVRRGVALSLGLVVLLEDEAGAAVPESLVEATVQAAVRADLAGAATPTESGGGQSAPSPRKKPSANGRFLLMAGLLAALVALLGRGRLLQAIDGAPAQRAGNAFLIGNPWPFGPADPPAGGAACHVDRSRPGR